MEGRLYLKMVQFKFKNKKIPFSKKGDKIQVKLLTEDYQTYYKREAKLSNDKEIGELRRDLINYGIDLSPKLGVDWFE